MSKTVPIVDKNIRKLRKDKGLSQDNLSRLADMAHTTIIKIESGEIKA